MKQLGLKPIPLIIVAGIILLSSSSCKKQASGVTEFDITRESEAARFSTITDISTVNPFTKTVGAPVDEATGTKWITNHTKKYFSAQTYTLSNAYLQSLVNQPNCVGICLYYGLDGNSKINILPIGIDTKGKIMSATSVSTMQGNITWATAQQWINNYKGVIKAHFFGSNTFGRLNIASCKSTRVDFAVNDEGKQQLLLSNTCVFYLLKQYEDRSLVCPPVCP